MVQPFTEANLKLRKMANIILDLPELKLRYPEVPKEVLEKFATPITPPPRTGYIPHDFIGKLNSQDKECNPDMRLNVPQPEEM